MIKAEPNRLRLPNGNIVANILQPRLVVARKTSRHVSKSAVSDVGKLPACSAFLPGTMPVLNQIFDIKKGFIIVDSHIVQHEIRIQLLVHF